MRELQVVRGCTSTAGMKEELSHGPWPAVGDSPSVYADEASQTRENLRPVVLVSQSRNGHKILISQQEYTKEIGAELATPEVTRISIKGGAKRPMVLIPSEDHSHVILLNQDLGLSGLTEIRASPRCRYMPRAFRGVVEHLSDNLASDSSVGAGVDLHDVRDPILI